jgi:predicted NUDIX family NTP pyrophosphohydrolase
MPKQSAGLLLYRLRGAAIEVFLVHPGGPFWAKKDAGAWSIPKGEFETGEDPQAAAQREFTEETGLVASGPFVALGTIRQSGGKTIHAFVGQAEIDVTQIKSNTFKMEWPPRSGRFAEFPEIDRAAWFSLEVAGEKINAGQAELLARLRHAVEEARKQP